MQNELRSRSLQVAAASKQKQRKEREKRMHCVLFMFLINEKSRMASGKTSKIKYKARFMQVLDFQMGAKQ